MSEDQFDRLLGDFIAFARHKQLASFSEGRAGKRQQFLCDRLGGWQRRRILARHRLRRHPAQAATGANTFAAILPYARSVQTGTTATAVEQTVEAIAGHVYD